MPPPTARRSDAIRYPRSPSWKSFPASRGTQSIRRIQKFLTDISGEEVLSFGQAEGKLAGEIDGDLERVGRPIGTCDPMIAAIALQHGLELVTGNTAHYQRVQQLGYPLTLANWRI